MVILLTYKKKKSTFIFYFIVNYSLYKKGI